MSNEQLQNEYNYTMSVTIIKKMMDNGLISNEEYNKIDLLNRGTFAPKLGAIMS